MEKSTVAEVAYGKKASRERVEGRNPCYGSTYK